MTWSEVARRARSSLLAVPLGSTEQHGRHLPLSTDADVATALADRLAAARRATSDAPALAYGASGEHAGFPGTLSIGLIALELVVVELVRSADAFAGVVLIDSHGGNSAAVAAAVHQLTGEGRAVMAWAPHVPGGDAHAGRTETSLMLAVDPGRVDRDAAARGDLRPLGELLPELRCAGVAAISPNGVLGDPSGATAEEGAALLAALAEDLAAAVGSRWPLGPSSTAAPSS